MMLTDRDAAMGAVPGKPIELGAMSDSSGGLRAGFSGSVQR